MSPIFGAKPPTSLSRQRKDYFFDYGKYLLGIVTILAFATYASAILSPYWRCKLFGSYCLAANPAPESAQATEPSCDLSEDAASNESEAQRAARAACRIKEVAHSFDAREDDETKTQRQSLLESYKWAQTQECAAAATDCAAKTCYSNYLAQFGNSALHETEARYLQRQAEQKCASNARASVADGHYLARSSAGCGSKPESVTVEIRGGRVSWRHEVHGTAVQWRGSIDQAGAITATVDNEPAYHASGQYTDANRNLTMIYPQCATAISMRIINKMSD
jgi:hypothetical protein